MEELLSKFLEAIKGDNKDEIKQAKDAIVKEYSLLQGKLTVSEDVLKKNEEELKTLSQNLKELKNTKANKKDNKDTVKREDYNKLVEALDAKEAEYKESLSKFETDILNKDIEYTLLKDVSELNVKSDKAREILISQIKDGAVINDGKLEFRDAKGDLLVNSLGKPLTVKDKVEDMKGGDYGFLFNTGTQTSNTNISVKKEKVGEVYTDGSLGDILASRAAELGINPDKVSLD